MSLPRPAWLPPLNSHDNYSIDVEIHQRESGLPSSPRTQKLNSIRFFFKVDIKFYDINDSNRTPIHGLALNHRIKINHLTPHHSNITKVKNLVRSGILRNRRFVPFKIDKINHYRQTDLLQPVLNESLDHQLHTDEDLVCCLADFLVRTVNKYHQAALSNKLEISMLMDKSISISHQEFDAWICWFQQQKRLNPHGFDMEYLAAITVPRTVNELLHESSMRTFKSASDSCIQSLDKLTLADSGRSSCPICMDELHKGDQVTKLPCFHIFHGDCIVQWLKTSHFCPICRLNMPTA